MGGGGRGGLKITKTIQDEFTHVRSSISDILKNRLRRI